MSIPIPPRCCRQCGAVLGQHKRAFCNRGCRLRYELEHPGPKAPLLGIDALSNKERQVFSLFLAGRRWTEIAKELEMSPKTVHSHRCGLLRKLKVKTPVELVVAGISLGLLTVEPQGAPGQSNSGGW